MVGKDEHDQGPSESRVASRLYFTTAVSSHGSLYRGPSTVAPHPGTANLFPIHLEGCGNTVPEIMRSLQVDPSDVWRTGTKKEGQDMAKINRQITLAARPTGAPKESDFLLIDSPMPSPGVGEVLVRNIYMSLDPYMRGRMSAARSYAPPVAIGEVMVGGTVGEVVQSKDPGFKAGDIAEGMLGWQEYGVTSGALLRKVDPSIAPISTALGILGMPGLTAYFGLLDVCDPRPAETVVVSGAAGAVGSAVGQIAKIKNCRVVGTAGSDSKVEYLTKELGFDGAFNYKTVSHYHLKLKELCPNGIDVYFDNVGGSITDEVMRLINERARIAICGQISQYNLAKPEEGPRWLSRILVNQAKIQGFLVFNFAPRYPEALRQLAQWLKAGMLKYREDVVRGLENAPRAFLGLFEGRNQGKLLVQIADPLTIAALGGM